MTQLNRWLAPALAGALLAGPAWAADTKADMKLLEGLQKLHAGNEGEVQMGQMGAQMASDPLVKAFAQRMVDDHSKNDQHLTQMATTMGMPLTGKAYQAQQKDTQKALGKVHGKTGAEFDKAFISAMVKDHEKDAKGVKTLANRARKDGQGEVAGFLDTTEQTMQQHLAMAKQIEQALKKGGGTASAARAGGTGAGPADAGAAGTSGTAK
jgi:putative membrane protein